MNILFLTVGQVNPHKGGIDRVCDTLATEFRRSGHYSIGCSFWHDEQETNDFMFQYQLPDSNRVLTDQNIDFVRKIILDHDIDILFNHSFQIAFYQLAALAKKGTKVKIVSVCHSDPEAPLKELLDKGQELPFKYSGIELIKQSLINILKYPVGYRLRKQELRRRLSLMAAMSDRMVVLSDKFIPVFESLSRVDNSRKKIVAISNPINLPDGGADYVKKNQILFVGRLDFQKRVDRLLRVWSSLQTLYPQWELVIVGDGEARELFQNYADRLKLHRVRFVGSAPSESYFKEAKIVCMSSTHESFGMVLIEAQKYLCVPIAYDSYKSVGDIIENGVNGFLVDPFSIKKYVSKAKVLIDNEDIRLSMAKNGRGLIGKFDAHSIAQKWIELFDTLRIRK